MGHRKNWPKRLLAGLLSTAMLTLNITTAMPAFAAPSAEAFREDAELVNDLALPKETQRRLQREVGGTDGASPSDASESSADAEVGELPAGSVRWGTPSDAQQILHTNLDGVEIEVTAPTGVLPEGATLRARHLTEEEEKEVLAKIAEHADTEGKTATAQFLCDLSVLNAAGEEIQPDSSKGALAVSFRNVSIVSAETSDMNTDAEETESKGVSVLHIDEDEKKVETLEEGLDEELPILQASTESFSPFAVVNYQSGTSPLGIDFKLLDYDGDTSRTSYKLKDVTVKDTAGRGITSINFEVDDGSINTLPETGTAAAGKTFRTVTDILPAHKFYQIIFSTPLTTAETKAFIENNLKFKLTATGASQQLKINLGNGTNNLPPASNTTLTKRIIPNPVSGDSAEHYYMYVSRGSAISWAESYNLAKSYYLEGMRGYLVTITSRVEDEALDHLTTQPAWSGGARFVGINDAASVPQWYNNRAPRRGVFSNQNVSGASGALANRTYRWQNGPETNLEYTRQGYGTLNLAYNNWNPGEPNSARTFLDGYESCMQVHDGSRWNDMWNLHSSVTGFFVEFSRYNQTGQTNSNPVPVDTNHKVSAVSGGQTYYFNNLDDAMAWSQQNGNAPLTLLDDLTLTQDIPAGVSINPDGHTLTVPSGANVVNNGTIDLTNPSSQLQVQGSNGNLSNAGNGQITRKLTVRMKDRHVTAGDTLTWALTDALITGNLIGNDRVSAIHVDFDNSSTAVEHPTLPVTASDPTSFDNGTNGSRALGTYIITYLPGTVTRDPHRYTVKFAANAPAGRTASGSMPDRTVMGGVNVDLTNLFSVDGFDFAGWTASDGKTYGNGATPKDLTKTNNGVITLTANWTPKNYTIQYTTNVNPSSRTAAQAVNPNTATSYRVSDPNMTLAPMTWPGYTFGGWYENAALSGTPVAQLITSSIPAGNKHYYAKWTPKNYTLTYQLNDTSGTAAVNPNAGFTSYTVETANHTLAAPTRTGYNFLGWYRDAGLTTPAPAVIDTAQGDSNPTRVYAKWSTPLQYSITYYMNDSAGQRASNPASNPGSFNVTSPNINFANPTRRGYTFQGWYTNPGLTTAISGINTSSPANMHNFVLYAKWSSANSYTVRYHLNDSTPAGHLANNPNTLTNYTVLDSDTALRPATRTGYNFLGWYDNPGFTGSPVSTIRTADAANKDFYAKWDTTPISYPIRYHLNDSTPAGHPASNPAANLTSYTVLTNGSGTINVLPALRNGYTFLGWYDNAALTDTPISSFSAMDAAPKNFYAKWSAPKSYTVQYSLNDAAPAGHPAVNPNTVTSYTVLDSNVTLAPATRTGYDFEGWYDNAAFSGSPITGFSASDAANKHYYAKWSAAKSYTVNWHLNDSTPAGHPATNPNTVASYTVLDSDVTIQPATRTGYSFLGWYDNPGFTGTPVTTLRTMDAANKNYYAKWDATPISYPINYVLNDGTPAGHAASNPVANLTSYTVLTNSGGNISLLPALRNGYTFLGWYDNASFTGSPISTFPASDAAAKTFYAKWSSANSYTVNYTLNDATPAGHPATNPNTVTSYTVLDANVTLAPATRNGYDFEGWYDNAAFTGTPITGFSTSDAADKHYYAKWSAAKNYTVQWNLNDSAPAGHLASNPNTVTSYSVLDADLALQPATRTGYDFLGWYDNAALSGSPVTTLRTADAADKQYYAKWSAAKTYTVQWNLNDSAPAGHPASNPNTVASYTVLDADITVSPATRPGYTFLGWYDNPGLTGTAVTTLRTMDAENKSYYAKWDTTPITYPINYVLNDGTPTGHPATNPAANLTSYTVLTNGGGNINVLPALRNGYTFGGWYDNPSFSGSPINSFSAMDAAPKTFYAKWSSANSYTVTYTLNDGTPAGHPATNPNTVSTYTVLDSNVTLQPATRTGYDFAGWYDNPGFSGTPITGFNTADAENKHYYAKWSAVKNYNVQYHLNDSTPAGHPASNPNTVTSYTVLDADVALRPATRTGYDFEGWYDNAALTGTPVTNLHTMDAENKQYYAKWSAAKNYTVQWELNDSVPAGHPATNPNTVTTYTVLDANVAIQPATRTGYSFLGWYADPAFTGSPVTNLHTMDAENKHYYARWSTPDSYSVTYHLNDATPAGHPATNPNTKLSYNVTEADFAIVPATRTGYTFEGWYDNPGFTGTSITSLRTMDAENKNYYAKWSAAQSYPINYVLNDSTSHPATNPAVNLTSYTVETLPNPIAVANPLRTGYSFQGWYDNPGFTGATISSFTAMDAAPKTFYAKWSAPLSYTVQYTLNDGTPAGHPATNPNTVTSYTVVDPNVTLSSATRPGYDFLGWYENPALTGTPVTGFAVSDAENKHYYAKWSAAKNYSVQWNLNDATPAGHPATNPNTVSNYTVEDAEITIHPATRTGYSFLGWYDNASLTGTPVTSLRTMDAENKQYYAKWSSTPISYPIVYTLNDGSPAGHPASNPAANLTSYTVLTNGSGNISLLPASRNGYTFEGWYDNAAFSGSPITGFPAMDAEAKHYYAKWSAANSYTVAYTLNDGTPTGHPATNPNTVISYTVLDSNVTLAPATRTGYDFEGWYENPAFTGSPVTGFPVSDAANKHFYAKWSAAKNYTVQWNLNDATPAGHPATNPNTVSNYTVEDADITISPATRTGYGFLGWYDNASLTGTQVTSLRTMDAENKQYYAKWSSTPISYPIVYTLNDVSPAGHPATNPAANLTSYTVLTNGSGNISLLPASRNGYTFEGWYDNASFTGAPITGFPAMDAEAKHYYAKWSVANTYTVAYTLNDGTPAGHPATNPNTVTSYSVLNPNVTLAPATRTGYDFEGWYENPAFTGSPVTSFSTSDAANKHFYAKWSAPKSYTVQWSLNDGTPAGHPATNPNTVTSYTVLDADVTVQPATRTGYDFLGWYDNAALTGTPVTTLHTMDAESKHYYAKWSAAKNYTVQWNLNDGAPAGHPASNPNTVTSYTVLDADVTIQPATRTGYTFLGWYDNAGFTGTPVTNLHTMDAENKQYFAKWDSTPISYPINYVLNDGTPAGHPASNPVANLTSYTVLTNGSGTVHLLPALRSGYSFLGWYDNPAFSGSPISSFSAMDAEAKTYYAKWSSANNYSVSYTLNDVTPAGHPATNPNTVTSYTVLDPNVTLAPATRTGYDFEGWYDNPAFTGTAVIGFPVSDAADKHYYAKWSAPKSYTVQWNLNDGTPAGHTATNPNTVLSYTVLDADVTIRPATRTGYDFEGWYDNPGLTGTPVTNLHTMDAENKQYYAKWSAAKSYTVQWHLNDATPAGHPASNPNTVASYTVQDADVTIQPATRTGYTFLGWYDNVGFAGVPVTTLRTMDAEDKAYYAKWDTTPNSYPINYVLNDGSPAGYPATNPGTNLTSYTVLTNGGGSIALQPASRNGYTFLGWYDNASFAGTPITDFPAMDAAAKTFYAKWSSADTYTVAYTLNDGTPAGHTATNPNTVTSYTVLDSNVTLAPATRTGYDFEGWYDNPSFTGTPITGFPTSDAENKHYYAKWSAAKSYTVQWNLNDNTPAGHPASNPNTVASYTVLDADVTIQPATRTGYTFLGWYDNAALTGTPVTSLRTMDAENKTYYAKWDNTPNSYPIHYVLNDGTPAGHPATNPAANLTSYTVLTNGSGNISLLPALRNGYTFEGWYDNAAFSGTPISGFPAMDAAPKTFYAKWSSSNNYSVTYTLNDVTPAGHPATNPNTVTSYTVLDPNVTLAPATRTGYDFEGWYDNPGFTGTPITGFLSSDAENKHYYAKWSAVKSYNVQYHLNDSTPAGHPASNPNTVTSYTVLDADVALRPATRTGYDFEGWYDNAALTGTPVTNLHTMDAENKQYYAKWSAAKNYTVQWELNDSAPAGHPATNPNTVTTYTVLDADVTIQPATRTGYNFLGWYADPAFTGSPVTNLHTMDAENKHYYARWSTPDSYSVTYHLNDATPAGHPATNPNTKLSYNVTEADFAIVPATRTGYTFEGWYDNPGFTGAPITSLHTMDAANKNYYAKWSAAQSYPINFVLNDSASHPATNPTVNLTSYTVETLPSPIAVANPLRTGYTFQGWYDNAAFTGAPISSFPAMDAAPKTFYAKWSSANNYSVTYTLNDVTPAGHPANNPNTVTSYTVLDPNVTLAPATRTGYDFEGWYDNTALSGTPITGFLSSDAENKHYYAKWSAPKNYTVQWNLNDSAPAGHPATNPNSVANYTVLDADVAIQPATRTGYTFLGWYDNPGLSGSPVTTLHTMDAENKAYYAKWDATPNSYPIHYVLNDGTPAGHPATNPTGNLTSYTVLTNGGGNISLSPASRNGYTFNGWYDNPGFSGAPITAFPVMDAAAKTFYAKWSAPNNYTVTYSLNDSTPAGHPANNPNTVTSYTVLDPNVTLAPATRTGYDFEGWYDNAALSGTPVTGFPASDAANKHFYAKWSAPKNYTVNWNLNDGTPAGHPATNPNTVTSYTVTDADVAIQPATRKGYDFLGWYDNAALTGTPVTHLHTMDAENKQYFAKWSPAKSYTVQWNLNDNTPAGHPASSPNTVATYTVEDADVTIQPATRTGYTFLGWYDNAALTGTPVTNLHTMDAENKQYFAKWDSTPISYPINYVLNDGSPVGHPATNPAANLTSYTVLTNGSGNINLLPALRNGYTFEGWYDNAAFSGAPITSFPVMDAAPKTYYAKWSSANNYSVTYTLNDVTPAGHPATNPNTVTSYTVLDPNVTLAPATRTGYDFEGWYDNPGFTGTPITGFPTSDATNKHYYAKWSAVKNYSVQYHLNDSTPAGHPASNPNTVTSYTVLDADVALRPATRTGYDFEGWYDNAALTGTPVTTLHTMDAENKNYYAKWSAPKNYTVQWELNDSAPAGHPASNPNTVATYIVLDADVAIQPATRTGYSFLGWYADPAFTGSPVTNLRTIDAENKHYYARWSSPDSYSITYHLNDASPAGHPATNPNTKLSYNVTEADFAIAAATRTGYTFLGWYDNPGFTGAPVSSLHTMDAENKNYYAKWSAAQSYPINYVLNDSASHPATNPAVNLTSYTVETLPSPIAVANPLRTGYTFLGWYDNPGFTGTPISAFPAMDAAAKTFYAKWSAPLSYTVQYTLNDGTPAGHPATNPNTVTSYTVLDSNVTLAPATRTGYDFEGWYDNPGFTGTPITGFPTNDAADKHYYAKWSAAKSYTVQWNLNDNTPVGHAANNPNTVASYTVEDADLTVHPATRTGYTFEGWYDNPGFTGTPVTSLHTMDAENKNYYAKWSAAPNSYPVNYVLNDGTPAGHPATNPAANLTSYTVLTNGSGNINLLPALRNGYTFEGWYDNAAFSGVPIASFPAMDAAAKTFYAKWSAPNNYAVAYTLNDGTPAGHPATNPNTVTSYTVLDPNVTLAPATRTGYDFEGWYDNAAFSGTPITGFPVSDAVNKHFYAKWSAPKNYTVNWNLNDSSPAGHPANNPNTVTSYTVTDADVAIQPATRTGYDFLGWYDNAAFTGSPVTNLHTMDAENKQYYAKWSPAKSFAVQWNLNDGTPAGHPANNPNTVATYTVEDADVAIQPATRTGFNFLGWYDNPAFTGTAVTTLHTMDAENKQYYAKWDSTPISYPISYQLNDGMPAGHPANNPAANPTSYDVLTNGGGNISLLPPSRNGFTFDGWYDNPTFSGTAITSFSATDASPKQFYAKWSAPLSFTVSYDLNDGTPAGHPASNPNTVTSYTVLDPNVTLAPATRTGYDFEGWYDNPAFTGSPVTGFRTGDASNKQFYAKWSAPKTYTVNWNLNDGTPAGHPATNPNTVATYTVLDADIAIYPATRTGYDFEGWYDNAAFTGTPVTSLHTMDAENKQYYAKWSAPKTYTVNWDLNDATPTGNPANNPNTVTGYTVLDPDFTLAPATRAGYTFLGWFDNAALSGTAVTTLHSMDATDRHYYARWGSPNSYQIYYHANDTAANPATNPNTVTSYTVLSSDFTLATPTRPGYTFEGWFDDAALTHPVTGLRVRDLEDKHFYMKWSQPNVHPINYVLNDRPASPASTVGPTSYTVEDADFALAVPTRNGATFLGWYDNAAFTGTPITTLHTHDAEPKIYYAKWSLTSYSMSYDLNPGGGIGTPTSPTGSIPSFTVEDEINLDPPVRRGYTGTWLVNGQPVTHIPEGTTGNLNLTAGWTVNHYGIRFETGETGNSPIQGLSNLPTSYTIEDAAITLPTPSRTGYTFVRWEKSSAPGVAVNSIPAESDGDMTFRAVWEPIRYRITYDTVGGINNSQNPTSFTIEDEVTLFGTVKEGVRFWTWQQVGGKFIHTIPAGTTHDISLVARYQKDQDTDNIGGGAGGGGTHSGKNGSGSGNKTGAGTEGQNPSATNGAEEPGTGMEQTSELEPVPQQFARQTEENRLAPSSSGQKMLPTRGKTSNGKARRLPKTGEASAADGLRSSALGLLPAELVVRRKREEQ
ncbi:InlB B-repeat-containing protein [Stomatobaculum longum]|uniref:InlB B-repeat-containing protein n=1 Tax=Stomatobaculum longum TaxID=796942 RepID=UPI0028EF064D|nr:InlB B-repeat-containing protein [Stomatobaculum longum]